MSESEAEAELREGLAFGTAFGLAFLILLVLVAVLCAFLRRAFIALVLFFEAAWAEMFIIGPFLLPLPLPFFNRFAAGSSSELATGFLTFL